MGKKAAGSTYAYAQLPNASQEQTISRSAAPGVTILRNSATTQAASLADGTTAATFWKPDTAGHFTINASLCLLAQRGKNHVDISRPSPA